MILALDPKDPIINFLKQKLIEIPFENTSKIGQYLISPNQSLLSSEVEWNLEDLTRKEFPDTLVRSRHIFV